MAEPSLEEIGRKHGTDKVTHGYLPHYERLFAPFRHDTFSLLEIGVRTGESVRMWHDYFPHARIVGLDIEAVRLPDEAELTRYTFVQGSQDDPETLGRLAQEHALRVIVDDGSHLWSHQIATFQALFPTLSAGGVYICEDIHTSFGGRRQRFRGDAAESAAAYFLRLAEIVIAGKARKLETPVAAPLLDLALAASSAIFIRNGVIFTRGADAFGTRPAKRDRRPRRTRAERAASRREQESMIE